MKNILFFCLLVLILIVDDNVESACVDKETTSGSGFEIPTSTIETTIETTINNIVNDANIILGLNNRPFTRTRKPIIPFDEINLTTDDKNDHKKPPQNDFIEHFEDYGTMSES
jgi:hypothetical protein